MTIAANSYGSVAEVATLTKRYTNNGSYDATTNPMVSEVEKFIDRLSARINALLAQAGFAIPVTQADTVLLLADFVVTEVVDYCHWANSAGRFMNRKVLRGRTPSALVDEEAAAFIHDHAIGIEQLGATRSRKLTYGMNFRDVDDDGNNIEAMFKRSAFNWKIN